MTPSEIKKLFKQAAEEVTGYDSGEAEAWAQGMYDALYLVARLPSDPHAALDFARHAARQ